MTTAVAGSGRRRQLRQGGGDGATWSRHALVIAAGVMSGCLTIVVMGFWAGHDLNVFLSAGHASTPYAEPGYRYSPLFAVLMSFLPPLPVSLALWRIASLAALALALRGTFSPLLLALIAPGVVNDLATANVTCFALALMVAILRWPSVRTAVVYGVVVVLVPKPAFVPMLLWAFVTIPRARLPLIGVGLAGAAMLLYPGYAAALLSGGAIAGTLWIWVLPLPVTVALVAIGCAVAVAALWRPRLLGLATVLMSGYWWPYVFAPLGLTLESPSVVPLQPDARSRANAG